jgi:hypothetical protein
MSEKDMCMAGFCIRFSVEHCINPGYHQYKRNAETELLNPAKFVTVIRFSVQTFIPVTLEEQQLAIQHAVDTMKAVVKFVTVGGADVKIYSYIHADTIYIMHGM